MADPGDRSAHAPAGLDWAEADNDAETPAGPSNPGPRRDRSFYLEPVTFQVGNTLFKVAKAGFQEPGTIFEAMFALPTDGAGAVEGSSDDNPIHLHGIDEHKFRSFLTVLYPSKPADGENQYRDLVGALDLATFWEFTKLRKEIISTLTPIIEKRNNLEVIFIARKYRVADWLRASYKRLVQTVPQLPIEDLSTSPTFNLDWQTMAKIFYIRDNIVRNAPINGNASCPQCSQQYGTSYGITDPRRFSCECRVVKIIDTQFQKEFDSMGEGLLDFFDIPFAPSEAPAGGKKKKGKRV